MPESGNNDLRLVIFDCDGTLVDGLKHQVAAMTEAFAEHGHAAPEEAQIRSLIGLNLEHAMSYLAPEAPDTHHIELAASYRTAFRRMRAAGQIEEPLFPGAGEAVRALADAGVLLGIATGKGRPGVDHLIAAHGFDGLFVTIQTPDNAPGKPHPGMVEQAVAETGVLPAHAVVIGDTVFDMEMAQNAGVAAIGVTWGFHPPSELTRAGAAHLLEHFDDLPPVLDRIWGAA